MYQDANNYEENLIYFLENGFEERAIKLIVSGKVTNLDNFLIYAVGINSSPVVKSLIENGADAYSKDGKMAIWLAIENKLIDVATLLLSYNMDIMDISSKGSKFVNDELKNENFDFAMFIVYYIDHILSEILEQDKQSKGKIGPCNITRAERSLPTQSEEVIKTDNDLKKLWAAHFDDYPLSQVKNLFNHVEDKFKFIFNNENIIRLIVRNMLDYLDVFDVAPQGLNIDYLWTFIKNDPINAYLNNPGHIFIIKNVILGDMLSLGTDDFFSEEDISLFNKGKKWGEHVYLYHLYPYDWEDTIMKDNIKLPAKNKEEMYKEIGRALDMKWSKAFDGKLMDIWVGDTDLDIMISFSDEEEDLVLIAAQFGDTYFIMGKYWIDSAEYAIYSNLKSLKYDSHNWPKDEPCPSIFSSMKVGSPEGIIKSLASTIEGGYSEEWDTCDENIIKKLIEERPEDMNNIKYYNSTPLWMSIVNGCPNITKLLLEAGSNPNLCAEESPLHYAARNGNTELLKLLVDYGAKSGDGGEGYYSYNKFTALQTSVLRNRLEDVKILLKTQDINNLYEKDGVMYEKYPTLHIACEKGYFDIAKLLVENGAKINSVNPFGEYLGRICPFEELIGGQVVMIRGYNELKNVEKNSMFYALLYSNDEIVKLLMQHGGKISIGN